MPASQSVLFAQIYMLVSQNEQSLRYLSSFTSRTHQVDFNVVLLVHSSRGTLLHVDSLTMMMTMLMVTTKVMMMIT